MFHDLLALLKECVPFSIAFVVVFNASYVHMLFLIVEGIKFNCGVDHFFCGSKAWGSFSLFDVKSVACYAIHDFFLFLVLASSNLVECVLTPPRVCLFLPYK